jgi:hypothetical protein
MRNPITHIKEAMLSGVVSVQVDAMSRTAKVTEPSAVTKISLAVGALMAPFVSSTAFAFAASSGCGTSAAQKLHDFLNSGAQFLIGIGAIGSLVMFVVGALFIMFSAGNESRASKGMSIVKRTVIGLIILAGGVFIKYVVLQFVQGATGSSAQKCLPATQNSP